MDFRTFFLNNWFIIVSIVVCVAIFALVVVCVRAIKRCDFPTESQIASIKKWLLYAVTEAENAFGSKTGQLKLHAVYDMAIERFEWLAFIPFETFSDWVDEALGEMREMLANNSNIKELVTGDK